MAEVLPDAELPWLLLERLVQCYPCGVCAPMDAVYRVALILVTRRKGDEIVAPTADRWRILVEEALGTPSFAPMLNPEGVE